MEIFSHPLIQSVLLPAVAAGSLLLLARFSPMPGVVAGAASLGMLACLLAAMGIMPWPARSGLHKIAWLLLVVTVFAPLLRVKAVPARIATGVGYGFIVAALVWLAWPILVSPSAVELLAFAACASASLVLVGRSQAGGRRASSPASAAAMLGVGALCLAAVALSSASLILAQLCGALAMAGAMVFVWATWEARAGGTSVLSSLLLSAMWWGRVCLVLVAALVLLLTEASVWPLLLLLPVFYADSVVPARVPSRWRPLTVAAAALVPGSMMVLMVWLGGAGVSPDDPYY